MLELHQMLPDLDLVAILQRSLAHTLIVHVSSVERAKILHNVVVFFPA